jgi:hypothetical protein
MSKFGLLLVMWFIGFLHYNKYLYRSAGEGFFWIFTTKDNSLPVMFSRDLFKLWIASCFLIFLPVDTKYTIGTSFFVLFLSSFALSFRK